MYRYPFLILFLFILAATELSAQSANYRHFEWDLLRIGYASPNSTFLAGGVALGTEARYNVTDRISAGLRFEGAIYTSDPDQNLVDIGGAYATSVTGDYYFRDRGGFRPFAGVGLGFFTAARATVTDVNQVKRDDFEYGNSLGLTPRVGLELGHLRVSLEYNYTLGRRVANYLGIMVAPTLFGGPKRETEAPSLYR